MKKKLTFVLSLILIMAMVLTACGGNETPPESTGEEVTDDGAGEEAGEATEETGEKIIHTNNGSEPGSLDPALAQGTHESWCLDHLFEGLMSYDENGELVDGAAEKDVEISDDQLTYTFKIKDGLKWSNGDPVTADDYAFAWKRILDPNLGADYAYQLYYIEGAEEYNGVEKPGIYYKKDADGEIMKDENGNDIVDHEVTYEEADLEGLDVEGKSEDEIAEMVYEKWLTEAKDAVAVEALDEKTLQVKLVAPTKYFIELTAFYSYYPVNKAVVEDNPDWAKDPSTFVSNGAFKLAEWNHNQDIKLRKNENFQYADKVKIDGIDFDILEDQNAAYQKYDGGEYDLMMDLPQSVVAKMNDENDPELVIGPEAGTYYYNLNNLKAPFNNANIRKAFVLALDRDVICNKIAQGGQVPATGIVPYGLKDENGKEFRESSGEYISTDYEANLAEAKELLDKGLEEEGLTLDDLNGQVILYNTSESHKKIAQVAQQMWKQAFGIDMTLENVEFQVKLDREKKHDFDISRAGWVGDYPDPMTLLDLFVTDGPFNDTGYSNPEYDELIHTAKTSPDQKVRMDSMREAEKILMNDMPIVPVYFYTQPYAVKPHLTGVYKPLLTRPIMTYAELAK